jgi:bifunctional DNA-binding transcriptional regulator/antitoxin component of YhaV-PrlF toxin-antitoxin module
MGNNATTYEVSRVEGKVVGVRKLQDRGRVQIPKLIRDRLHIKDSDAVYWIEDERGNFYLVKACPVSG